MKTYGLFDLSMKFNFLQRRGVPMAIFAALGGLVLTFIVLAFLYWALRPFVWAAVFGVPYTPPAGPYARGSGEWIAVQVIGFLSYAGAGYAAAKWSKPKSPGVWISLALIMLMLGLVGGMSSSSSVVSKILLALPQPSGVICGAMLFCARMGERLERGRTIFNIPPMTERDFMPAPHEK